MTTPTYIVLRLTTSEHTSVVPVVRAVGPCFEGEARELLRASQRLLELLDYEVRSIDPHRVTARRKPRNGLTHNVWVLPLEPTTEDPCEGIT